MTKKEFLHAVSNGKADVIQIFLDALAASRANYCLIGGLAVNAYAEPVVSLDLDVVIAIDDVDSLCEQLITHFKIVKFPHSINLSSEGSDLRIQVQTDPRYQSFVDRATIQDVLGYEMKVANIEDVLQGKVWAYLDEQRRKSKRQKDLADIVRLLEVSPPLANKLPDSIKKRIE